MFHFKVIIVHEISDADGAEDYLIGERGNQKGKVPKAFLELLTYWADRTDQTGSDGKCSPAMLQFNVHHSLYFPHDSKQMT